MKNTPPLDLVIEEIETLLYLKGLELTVHPDKLNSSETYRYCKALRDVLDKVNEIKRGI